MATLNHRSFLLLACFSMINSSLAFARWYKEKIDFGDDPGTAGCVEVWDVNMCTGNTFDHFVDFCVDGTTLKEEAQPTGCGMTHVALKTWNCSLWCAAQNHPFG